MRDQFSLGSRMAVLSATLHSKDTAATYTVEATPICEYFDGWSVSVSNGYFNLSELEKAAIAPFLRLKNVAVQGARQAVLTEEVSRIAGGLIAIITPLYNPDGRLQVPEPRYELDSQGNPAASFTAHFTTCPVEDAKKMAAHSKDLRKRVFDTLFDGSVRGFERYN